MSDMSRAIRLTIDKYAPGETLSTVPSDVLDEFWQITAAFAADMKNELEKRVDAP